MRLHLRMVDPTNEDFRREYLVSPDATFYDFYRFLCNDLQLPTNVLMSFYKANDYWEKELELTLLDMGDEYSEIPTAAMSELHIRDILQQQGDHLIFCYDIFLNRSFYCVLLDTAPERLETFPAKCIIAEGANPDPSQDMNLSVDADIADFYS